MTKLTTTLLRDEFDLPAEHEETGDLRRRAEGAGFEARRH